MKNTSAQALITAEISSTKPKKKSWTVTDVITPEIVILFLYLGLLAGLIIGKKL
jgi:hypothetical protein